MALGGFAPLPLRLGGPAEYGVSAAQWNRIALDASAIADSTPLLVAVIEGETVLALLARGGCSAAQCTVDTVSALERTVTLPASYLDEESGLYYSQVVTSAIGQETGTGPVAATPTGNVVSVVTSSSTSIIAVAIFGSTGRRYAGEYGGDPAKRDSLTDVDPPYAWQWYQELVAGMGSAYSTSETAFVTFERRAQARMHAYNQRLADLYAAQQNPGSSDALLGRWATIMALPKGQPDWRVRRKARARFALFSGVTSESLEQAVTDVLGACFVGFVRYPGTLDDPPFPTYWPEGTVGPRELGLDDDGAWLTQRCHLTISVNDAAGFDVPARAGQITRDLAEVLDGALPAISDWNWAAGADTDTGFLIGISRIGVDAL